MMLPGIDFSRRIIFRLPSTCANLLSPDPKITIKESKVARWSCAHWAINSVPCISLSSFSSGIVSMLKFAVCSLNPASGVNSGSAKLYLGELLIFAQCY